MSIRSYAVSSKKDDVQEAMQDITREAIQIANDQGMKRYRLKESTRVRRARLLGDNDLGHGDYSIYLDFVKRASKPKAVKPKGVIQDQKQEPILSMDSEVFELPDLSEFAMWV
ncbi:MAG: hypothetical protein ABSC05_40675 [Candidatus Solibacter sp.]|jgi:hypothetical protein